MDTSHKLLRKAIYNVILSESFKGITGNAGRFHTPFFINI